jgi:hypothetical protein
MRVSLVRLAAGSAIAFALVIGAACTANAQSVMKVCGDQWKAAKAAGTTNGETWPQFLAQCRTQQTGAAAPAPTTYAPPAAPAQTYGQAPTAGTGMTTT